MHEIGAQPLTCPSRLPTALMLPKAAAALVLVTAVALWGDPGNPSISRLDRSSKQSKAAKASPNFEEDPEHVFAYHFPKRNGRPKSRVLPTIQSSSNSDSSLTSNSLFSFHISSFISRLWPVVLSNDSILRSGSLGLAAQANFTHRLYSYLTLSYGPRYSLQLPISPFLQGFSVRQGCSNIVWYQMMRG